MKDSRQGTFGVLAITMSVLVRVTALAALTPAIAVAVLPTAHAFGRAGSMWLLALIRTASDGLGARYAEVASRRRAAVGSGAALLIGGALTGVWAGAFVAATIVAIGTIGLLSIRKIGGVTGDVAGAAEQLSEMAVLVVAAAVVSNGAHSPALWW
jgi:adenosylcobinamide-GDP ribazoletransferase